MSLQKSFLVACLLGILMVTGWELYWRSRGVVPNIDDNRELWARQIKKLDHPDDSLTVFIGSSRILFDIQRQVWKTKTGKDPVMLAVQGGSPLPSLKFIVEETDYRGLLVIGVTPGLFFFSTSETDWPLRRTKAKIDYYKDRTLAQRLNYSLSIPLQRSLAFYRDGDEEWSDDVDLKTLLENCIEDERAGRRYPPFNNFEDVQVDRNVQMSAKTTNDTAFANTVIKAWGLDDEEPFPFDKPGVVGLVNQYAAKYTKEGGRIVLLRCPSKGKFREVENLGRPRKEFWDTLVGATKLPAYHFEDYPGLQGLNLPELSHLSKEDANLFTARLIDILREDGHLNKRP